MGSLAGLNTGLGNRDGAILRISLEENIKWKGSDKAPLGSSSAEVPSDTKIQFPVASIGI